MDSAWYGLMPFIMAMTWGHWSIPDNSQLHHGWTLIGYGSWNSHISGCPIISCHGYVQSKFATRILTTVFYGCHIASDNLISIGSGNGLLLSGIQCWFNVYLGPLGQTSGKSESTYKYFLSIKVFENVICKMAAILSRSQCVITDCTRPSEIDHQHVASKNCTCSTQ